MSGPPPGAFRDRLASAAEAAGSVLCVGLDPDPDRLPPGVAVADFCVAVVRATAPAAAAFKPNLAFFEALGREGADALDAACAAVRDAGRLLVLDGKRGDIGSTGARYAHALYDTLGGDAATVAPYMGADSLAPFLAHAGHCAFVLVATSNPGGADVQDLPLAGGGTVADAVARLAVETARGRPGEVGFVAGATRPERLAALRAAHPDVPLLVPGVGAQGGSAREVMAANASGPILVNASRSVLYASRGADFASAAADAARTLASDLSPR